MVRMTHWMGMLLLACMSAGCGSLYDTVDSTFYQINCDHRAKSAWMDVRDLYSGVAFPFNFGEGFRAGYRAVCMGNDTGCAPPLPPRRYWSSCYLNCEGKARAMAWYDGYAHGVVAASCDGCEAHSQIVTGAANGSGVLGSALKGYKPPAPNPNPYLNQYGSGEYGPEGLGPDDYGPGGYGPEPTPIGPAPDELPPDEFAPGETFPEDAVPEYQEEFAPEAPAVLRDRNVPHLPAAELYRVPVF